jgi:tRNA nucleotidyltransferase/poly(A) polymerase
MKLFTARGLRVVPTGIDHGTVTLVTASGPVEITTLRTDVATDGRHATVAFGKSFEDDAARRDFSINAMFEDARGIIYDYHGGRADLDAKVLRFVGDPVARIREDFLRSMRFFRFWARFGFAPAPGTLTAVTAERDGLRRISQERLTSELMAMLAARHLREPLQAMCAAGVLAIVLPESATRWTPETLIPPPLPAVMQPKDRSLALLAWLVAAGSKPPMLAGDAGPLAQRLKLANSDGKSLRAVLGALSELATCGEEVADALFFVDACESLAGDGAYARWIAPVLATIADAARSQKLARINVAEVTHGHRRRAAWPIDGHWLKARGLSDGPELGATLARLKRDFFNGLWTTADDASKRLKQ